MKDFKEGQTVICIKDDPSDVFFKIPLENRWHIGDKFVIHKVENVLGYTFLHDRDGQNINAKRVELVEEIPIELNKTSMQMKEQIIEIAEKLKTEVISEDEALQQLSNLIDDESFTGYCLNETLLDNKCKKLCGKPECGW
jgi:hypothetical protein